MQITVPALDGSTPYVATAGPQGLEINGPSGTYWWHCTETIAWLMALNLPDALCQHMLEAMGPDQATDGFDGRGTQPGLPSPRTCCV